MSLLSRSIVHCLRVNVVFDRSLLTTCFLATIDRCPGLPIIFLVPQLSWRRAADCHVTYQVCEATTAPNHDFFAGLATFHRNAYRAALPRTLVQAVSTIIAYRLEPMIIDK